MHIISIKINLRFSLRCDRGPNLESKSQPGDAQGFSAPSVIDTLDESFGLSDTDVNKFYKTMDWLLIR